MRLAVPIHANVVLELKFSSKQTLHSVNTRYSLNHPLFPKVFTKDRSNSSSPSHEALLQISTELPKPQKDYFKTPPSAAGFQEGQASLIIVPNPWYMYVQHIRDSIMSTALEEDVCLPLCQGIPCRHC